MDFKKNSAILNIRRSIKKNKIMTTQEFKKDYYLEKTYEKISETEFNCILTMKKKSNGTFIDGLKFKINILETGQAINESQSVINSISWENYLNETIKMQFNLLMFKIGLEDIYDINTNEDISAFFEKNPLFEDSDFS